MALEASMSGPYKQNLKWIDSNDPNLRREVRMHAQRESHRAKRQRQREEYEQVRATTTRLFGLSREPASSATPAVSSSGETTPSGEPSSSSTGYLLGSTVQTTPWALGEQLAVTGAVVEPLPVGLEAGGGSWIEPSLVPPAQLSSGASFTNPTFPQPQPTTSRRDLLRAVPLDLDEDSWALVNHYLNDAHRMLFDVRHFFATEEFLFPLACSAPLPFQAMILLFSATQLARLQGHDRTSLSIRVKARTVQMLKERLESDDLGQNQGDETIAAMLAMANIENLFGDRETASLHMRSVLQIIRRRGGPVAVATNRKLGAYTNWVDYIMVPPADFNDLPLFSTSSDGHIFIDPSSKFVDLEDFIDFLSNAELLSAHQKQENNLALRHSLFQADSVLHRVLFAPPPAVAPHVDHFARLAALIYIHKVLWDLRFSLEDSERYIAAFGNLCYQSRIPENLSFASLVWVLLKLDLGEVDESILPNGLAVRTRPWCVGRFFRVAKLLSLQSARRLHLAMWGFLEMPDDGMEFSTGEGQDWKVLMREEILRSRGGEVIESV